jgi:hypothetical protein
MAGSTEAAGAALTASVPRQNHGQDADGNGPHTGTQTPRGATPSGAHFDRTAGEVSGRCGGFKTFALADPAVVRAGALLTAA